MRLVLLLCFLPCIVLAQSQPTLCGNNVKDVGEFCDDGNQLDGDGCTKDCRLERCGDGAINNAGKEECDDGNTNNDDGCSQSCRTETASAESQPGETSTAALISPEEAFRKSLVTTLFFPPGLGIIYGPSVGHFAAGEAGRGIGMTFLRAALVGGAIGIGAAIGSGDLEPGLGTALLYTDAGLLFVLAGLDILDAPKAAERAKERQEKEEP